MREPTEQQRAVLEERANCVVIARPGSGKTFTLARKLQGILAELPEHRGVAAISFTNKASDELQTRCLSSGVPKKSSFFGTIDKFFISEVLAFLPHVIGRAPRRDVQIVRTPPNVAGPFSDLLDSRRVTFTKEEIAEVGNLYAAGQLALELVPKLGVYVFDHSAACRRYLRARYSHVAVDEYQDSGFEQHQLFLRMKNLGVTALAVGDLDQSIYAFSRRSSEFLTALTQDQDFRSFAITQNHRCHESIVHYSLRLINDTIQVAPPANARVYDKRIDGHEPSVAAWLDASIAAAKRKFEVEHSNEVVVLVRGNRSAQLISQHLTTPHKLFAGTAFDEDNSLWGGVFRSILNLVFQTGATRLNLIEDYLGLDFDPRVAKGCLRILRQLQSAASNGPHTLQSRIDEFIAFATAIYPRAENRAATAILQKVLTDTNLLGSFVPARPDQVQLMTIHKSKGLEFDVVFHLDLHQWILPGYQAVKGISAELTQDLNLHYVGVTRARKCVVLCTSTRRTNSQGEVVDAEPAAFLTRHGLDSFRKHL